MTLNPSTKKPYTTMRKELDRVLKAVNIELKKNGASVINKPLQHHLLRHSFGTNAIKIKAFSLVELKEYMGHTSINDHYAVCNTVREYFTGSCCQVW